MHRGRLASSKNYNVFLLGVLFGFFTFFVFNNKSEAAGKFLSPISYIKSVNAFSTKKNIETFSFAPGWGRLDNVNFLKSSTVAYYDVPINDDGTLTRDASGYQIFRSDFVSMIPQAHSAGARVAVTLSMTYAPIIETFLDDPLAQTALTHEAINEIDETGIDAVVLDIEYGGKNAAQYGPKYSRFVSNFVNSLHQHSASVQVDIALAGFATNSPFYKIDDLGIYADRIFLMAYDFATPEIKNSMPVVPVYSYKENEYWQTVSSEAGNFLKVIPPEKLVLETAWYGNGDDYPLHDSGARDDFTTSNTLETPLSQSVIESMVANVPVSAQKAVRKNLPYIADALKKEGILSPNILAYALATIEHETAGTFEPIEEYGGRKNARRLGYEGGTNYFGRGFIQLTHIRNYKKFGQRIGFGDQLVRHPEIALRPDVSAKILAAFFKDNGIARLVGNGDFVDARLAINPDNNGWSVANLTYKFIVVPISNKKHNGRI